MFNVTLSYIIQILEKKNSATTKLVALPMIKGVYVLIGSEMEPQRLPSMSPCLFDTEDTGHE